MSAVHVVRLVRGDREFEVSIGRSYSTEQLSRMFNVDPGSIWLRSRYGNEVYFPNPEGVFDLPSERVLPYAEFSVEGESMTRHLQGQASAQSSAGQANTHTPVMQRTPGPSNYHGSPAAMPFTSVVNRTGKRPASHEQIPSYRLKIIQATMTFASTTTRKPTFTCLGQTFVELTEFTANVPSILAAVQMEFGNDYVIVTGNGLEVKDSPGTDGKWQTDE